MTWLRRFFPEPTPRNPLACEWCDERPAVTTYTFGHRGEHIANVCARCIGAEARTVGA